MDFRELDYIISIAKHKGVGKAAEEMHVSQPTLSKFVQNFEASLGQPIFRKVGNKFLLTYAGERYVETSKTILKIKQDLDKELADAIKNDVGELKIAFRRFGGFSVLSQALILFKKQFPRIKVSIYEDHANVLEQMVLNGDIDLAFIVLQSMHPDIAYDIIKHEEVLLIMSPDHPQAKNGVHKHGCRYPWMDVSKLEHEQFILQWPEQRIRQLVDRIFRDAGIKPTNVLTITNVYASVQLSIDGYGMAFVGETPLHFVHASKFPACFSVGDPCTTFDFVAVYRSGAYLPVYAKYFISIVNEVVNRK